MMKTKKKVIKLKMRDLIRVGTPTLPESGDVFHFKQTLDHSLGGEEVFCQRRWVIQ